MPHFASMMRTGINTGVLADSHAHSRARGGNFCSHGLLMSPGTTLAVIHIKTSSKSFYIPVPHISTFSMETPLVCFSFPIDPFCCKCYERQPWYTCGPLCCYHAIGNVFKGNSWHLPRLARLRVRTPSVVVLSPLMEEVFSTAFMFSCSAASSAYCSPWGWLWQGGELLENLPDWGRKTGLLF